MFNLGLRAALVAGMVVSAAEPHRLLIHRIGPSAVTIITANGDGSAQRPLLGSRTLDYNPSMSADGSTIVFTSERDGSPDLYLVKSDGTGLRRLTDNAAYDDQAALSPDGTAVAFVSTRGSGSTDVWVMDVRTRQARNLTSSPGGDFRPAWSPDGRLIAFSSDRGTTIERNLPAWEHLQRTSIYVVPADGGSARRVTDGTRSAGSPKWSPDGQRLVFYEMDVRDTHMARTSAANQLKIESQVVSVALNGEARIEHTSGPGMKVSPQFLSADRIGYVVKAGPRTGLADTAGHLVPDADLRTPSWSRNATQMVVVKPLREPYPARAPLFSFTPEYALSHLSTLPAFSHDGRSLAMSTVTVPGPPTNREYAIEVSAVGPGAKPERVFRDPGAALGPKWSHDDQWIVFALGPGFESRDRMASIVMMRPDGSGVRTLVRDLGAGFPSFSPDGHRIVYRVWGPGPGDRGLRIFDLRTSAVTKLTDTDYDTFPDWSPTGELIAFTSWRNGDFDIFTIHPDGTGLKQLTTTTGNDAHSSWSPDGRSLMFASSRHGFKDEAALMDGQPQPYGEIFVMSADGRGQRALTDNQWEDGPGAWQPAIAAGGKP